MYQVLLLHLPVQFIWLQSLYVVARVAWAARRQAGTHLSGELDDPGRGHDHAREHAEAALLLDLLHHETRRLVVVRALTVRTRYRHDLLHAQTWQFFLIRVFVHYIESIFHTIFPRKLKKLKYVHFLKLLKNINCIFANKCE